MDQKLVQNLLIMDQKPIDFGALCTTYKCPCNHKHQQFSALVILMVCQGIIMVMFSQQGFVNTDDPSIDILHYKELL